MIFDLAQRVICISQFESDIVRSHFGVPLDKISIVPNGVDIIEHGNESGRIKNGSNPIRLLYVGYLIELKGIQYILKAVQTLIIKMKLDVELVVAGSGYYEPVLRKLAKDLGIGKNVKWVGDVRKNDLIQLYRDADISLLLSASENFGTVVAESLAVGTPAIVTMNSALAEFVNERGCYGIENPSDAVGLADLILEIVGSGGGVGPLTNKIQTWDSVSRSLREVYSQAICEPWNRKKL